MRLLNDTGLVVISLSEWPSIKKTMLNSGYILDPYGKSGDHKELFTPDGTKCVSDLRLKSHYVELTALLDCGIDINGGEL